MKKIILFAIIFPLFNFCGVKKSIDSKKLMAIKFMGTITTYPVAVNERIFWSHPEEHVVYSIGASDDIISRVNELPESDGESFSILKYAFLVKNGKGTRDTIYADYNLKTWKFSKNGNYTYRYDNTGYMVSDLSSRYSFFRPCW